MGIVGKIQLLRLVQRVIHLRAIHLVIDAIQQHSVGVDIVQVFFPSSCRPPVFFMAS